MAAEDALVVPTIFDTDKKSLGEVGRESRRLAARVRAGEVTPPESAGGTFTVSNLGMFGMTAIYPVINSPQAAILGVGKTRSLLVRDDDGEIEDALADDPDPELRSPHPLRRRGSPVPRRNPGPAAGTVAGVALTRSSSST